MRKSVPCRTVEKRRSNIFAEENAALLRGNVWVGSRLGFVRVLAVFGGRRPLASGCAERKLPGAAGEKWRRRAVLLMCVCFFLEALHAAERTAVREARQNALSAADTLTGCGEIVKRRSGRIALSIILTE